jgi:hypothetical protein
MLAPTLSESFVRKLEGINGWLAPQAAEFTAYLFQSGLRGNVVEFGVFHGKYLAALYYLTATLQSRVLGVDAFFGSADVDISQQVIIENIREACGDSDRLSLFCANTMSLKRDDVLKLLPEPIAFISVDAGHESENLVNDISLAAELIAPGGIIALDDAFNYTTPGAVEGTCRYFEQNNNARIAPFAHCYNKLFITSAEHHSYFLEITNRYLHENKTRDYCANTLSRREINEASGGYKPRFFGFEIVPFL